MEHRWGNRVRTHLDVKLFAPPASAGWGRLRDVSLSGGFIETRLAPLVLSPVYLTLAGPDWSAGPPRVIHAVVARCAEDGVGVEWFDGDTDVIAEVIQQSMERRRRIATAMQPSP